MAGKGLINGDVCQGCALCTVVCPKKIVLIDRDSLNAKGYNPVKISDMDNCIACAMCAMMCPDSAIKVEKE